MALFPGLPLSIRIALPDQKAGGSTSPVSKILGDPAAILTASKKVPNVAPRSFVLKAGGSFARAIKGDPVITDPVERAKARLNLQVQDRRLRAKASPRVALDSRKPTGWDWIKGNSRIRPNEAGGLRGLLRLTRAGQVRGTRAGDLQIPASALDRLGRAGALAATAGPRVSIPIGQESTPILTAGPDDGREIATPVRALPGPTVGDQAAPSVPSLLYIVAALVVVFFVVRG